jgi:hypothetical protein
VERRRPRQGASGVSVLSLSDIVTADLGGCIISPPSWQPLCTEALAGPQQMGIDPSRLLGPPLPGTCARRWAAKPERARRTGEWMQWYPSQPPSAKNVSFVYHTISYNAKNKDNSPRCHLGRQPVHLSTRSSPVLSSSSRRNSPHRLPCCLRPI